jgi:hypothetical protein
VRRSKVTGILAPLVLTRTLLAFSAAIMACAHARPRPPVKCTASQVTDRELEIYEVGIRAMVNEYRYLTIANVQVSSSRRAKAMFDAALPKNVDAPFEGLRREFEAKDSVHCVSALAERLGIEPVDVMGRQSVGVSHVVVVGDWAYFQAVFSTQTTFVVYGLLLDYTHGLWRLHSKYMLVIS